MKVGYYLAATDEFRGNCIKLAGLAQMLWQRSICAGFSNPSKFDGVRIIEDVFGRRTKQLLVQNFFRGDVVDVIIHDVE
jgi:hypothetical protein